MSIESIKHIVEERIRGNYHNYPILLSESPEEVETLWLQVFAVPAKRVREVKDFIHDLQDEIGDANGILLLPMVKSIEVTKKHYPQYAPTDFSFMTTVTGGFYEKIEINWDMVQSIPQLTNDLSQTNKVAVPDYQLLQSLYTGTDDSFQSSAPVKKATDAELALAA